MAVDRLSRIKSIYTQVSLNYDDLQWHNVLKSILEDRNSSLNINQAIIPTTGARMYCDFSNGTSRSSMFT